MVATDARVRSRLRDRLTLRADAPGCACACVGTASVAPLLVIEFLHRVADILKDYCGELTESTLKESFVSAYEVR